VFIIFCNHCQHVPGSTWNWMWLERGRWYQDGDGLIVLSNHQGIAWFQTSDNVWQAGL